MVRIHSTLLLCKNIDATATFYTQLGFSVHLSNDSLRIMFGDYRLTFVDEKSSALKDSGEKKGIGMFLFFEVEDVYSWYQSLKEKHITMEEITGRVGGKRRFTVYDPDGYKLVFFSPS